MRRSVWLTVLVILFLLAAAYLTDRYEISSAETAVLPASEAGAAAADGSATWSVAEPNTDSVTEPAKGSEAGPVTGSATESASGPAGERTETATSEAKSIDFTLSDLNGNPVSLSDYKGKVVYLNFWATWCKWCKKEMPDMEAIHQAYSDLGLVILAVSVGEETEKVAQFIQENQYTFQTLLDPDKTVSQAYGVKPIPVSIFIDRNGQVAYRKLGYMDEERMREQIDLLISS
ncbi:peroxiredoxin family protein [Paenibacillus sp. CAU 1782]